MKLVFEKGDRGFICKSPEDGGAWVVPAHRERHSAPPTDGHIVAVEIVGTSANGRLRFARIVEDISATQDAALDSIKEAATSATTFNDLKEEKWGAIGISTYVSPWTYDVKTCLDEEGRPAIESVKVTGFLKAEWGRPEAAGVFSPTITFDRPLPLDAEKAQLMLAYHVVAMATRYTSATPPEWAAEFVEQVGELAEVVRQLEKRSRKQWYDRQIDRYSSGQDWPVMLWLLDEAKRVGAFDLRDLIEQVALPLEEVEVKLEALGPEPVKKYTKEELVRVASFQGSESGPLGEWPSARLPETPQAGQLLYRGGEWYVAVAGVRRELYKGGIGGLYARWVKVPKEVSADWKEE